MSEVLYMKISTPNLAACSQRQMHTGIHHSVIHYEHTTSKYGSRTSDQFIRQVLKKERKTVNTYKEQ